MFKDGLLAGKRILVETGTYSVDALTELGYGPNLLPAAGVALLMLAAGIPLNAGTALYTANVVDSIGAGIAKAREVLASGAARAKLDAFVACTKKLA